MNKDRKEKCDAYIYRMIPNRVAKKCKENKPYSEKPSGRPPRRWIDADNNSRNKPIRSRQIEVI